MSLRIPEQRPKGGKSIPHRLAVGRVGQAETMTNAKALG